MPFWWSSVCFPNWKSIFMQKISVTGTAAKIVNKILSLLSHVATLHYTQTNMFSYSASSMTVNKTADWYYAPCTHLRCEPGHSLTEVQKYATHQWQKNLDEIHPCCSSHWQSRRKNLLQVTRTAVSIQANTPRASTSDIQKAAPPHPLLLVSL